jgi:hypothetical protein
MRKLHTIAAGRARNAVADSRKLGSAPAKLRKLRKLRNRVRRLMRRSTHQM